MKTRKELVMVAKVALPEDFRDMVQDAMEDEIAISERKWNVTLTQEQKDNVIQHSWNQLHFKIKESYQNEWNNDKVLEVKILSTKEGARIPVPSKTSEKSKTRLVRSKQQWMIDKEASSEAVNFSDFHNVVYKEIINWAKTAVLYGVASYGN